MRFTSFILSERFERAVAMAASLHRSQTRKNIPSPFMAHLMSVAALVTENIGFICDDPKVCEDYVITAVLHDAIEDQGGQAAYDLLLNEFGKEIAENVLMLSDSIPNLGEVKPPKSQRNQYYLEKIRQSPEAIVLISCCDKIHNLRTMVMDARVFVPQSKFWSAFSQSPELTIANYQRLRAMYAERLSLKRILWLYDDALSAVEHLEINELL